MTFPRLPRLFWILWWGTIANRIGMVVVPFMTFYLTSDRGYSTEAAGLVVAGWGLGAFGAGPLGGVMADRFGRRPTALFGLISGAVVILAVASATSLWAIAVLTFLLGLFAETYRPAVAAAIADIVPPQDRMSAYALQYWAINIGFAAAAAGGGWLAGFGYELLFIFDAATTLVFAAIVWAWVPETQTAAAAASTQGSLVAVFRDRVFIRFISLGFLTSLVFLQSSVSLSADFQATGYLEADYGTVMAVNGILIVILQPFAAARLTRMRGPWVLAAASLLLGIGFGLHGVQWGLTGHAFAVGVWTIAEIAMSPVTSSIVANLAPADSRGRYQGVWTMTFGLAAFLGPIIGSRLYASLGPAGLWGSCVLVGAACGVLYLLDARSLETRLARTSSDDPPE